MGLILNGIAPADEWGFACEEYPDHETPKRNVTTVSIPGRNGDLTIDNGNWKNIDAQYVCHWLTEHDAAVLAWLSNPGYVTLQEAGAEWHYYARFKGGVTFENHGGVLTQAKLKFDCIPLKYIAGETPVVVSRSGENVRNNGTVESRPLIKVSVPAGGSGSISFNGYVLQLSGVPGACFIDCNSLECYSAGEAAANYNQFLSGFNMPTLKPGDNAIFFDGNITGLEITVRGAFL